MSEMLFQLKKFFTPLLDQLGWYGMGDSVGDAEYINSLIEEINYQKAKIIRMGFTPKRVIIDPKGYMALSEFLYGKADHECKEKLFGLDVVLSVVDGVEVVCDPHEEILRYFKSNKAS